MSTKIKVEYQKGEGLEQFFTWTDRLPIINDGVVTGWVTKVRCDYVPF